MTEGQTYVIRRSFVLPMGLMIALTLALMVVCIMQGQAIAKVVILGVLLLPMVALFIESAFRRLVVNEKGITASRLFRRRDVLFADVTSLESVQVRSRVFLTLSLGPDDFLIISNSYANFPELVKNLVAAVPEGTVTEEAEQLAEKPPRKQADVFTAWFAVIALVYVLIAQF
jgi:hypothetical protein